MACSAKSFESSDYKNTISGSLFIILVTCRASEFQWGTEKNESLCGIRLRTFIHRQCGSVMQWFAQSLNTWRFETRRRHKFLWDCNKKVIRRKNLLNRVCRTTSEGNLWWMREHLEEASSYLCPQTALFCPVGTGDLTLCVLGAFLCSATCQAVSGDCHRICIESRLCQHKVKTLPVRSDAWSTFFSQIRARLHLMGCSQERHPSTDAWLVCAIFP